MYHPAWRAWVDGQPARVYATNLVMRGVLVPAGATSLELRFVPFMASWPGIGLLAAGLVLGGLIFGLLRHFTRGAPARSIAEKAAPAPA